MPQLRLDGLSICSSYSIKISCLCFFEVNKDSVLCEKYVFLPIWSIVAFGSRLVFSSENAYIRVSSFGRLARRCAFLQSAMTTPHIQNIDWLHRARCPGVAIRTLVSKWKSYADWRRQVVQRSKGLWFHPTQFGRFRRIRSHQRGTACGVEWLGRRSGDFL